MFVPPGGKSSSTALSARRVDNTKKRETPFSVNHLSISDAWEFLERRKKGEGDSGEVFMKIGCHNYEDDAPSHQIRVEKFAGFLWGLELVKVIEME